MAAFWRYFLLALLLASCRLGFEPLLDSRVSRDGLTQIDSSPQNDALRLDASPAACVEGGATGQCPGNCVGQRCEIDCSAAGSCSANLVCPPGLNCEFKCGVTACSGIVCEAGSDCDIRCDGALSCGGEVNCKPGSKCDVRCDGQGSCGGLIQCDGECSIECGGVSSCADVDCRDACACDVTCTPNSCGSGAACPLPAACDTGLGCSNSPLCLATC